MARSVRKLGLFTLMALLLLAIVVTAVLSVVAYDRATSGSAQARVLYNLTTRVGNRSSQVSLFLQRQLEALEGQATAFAGSAPQGEEGVARLAAAQEALGLQQLCFVDASGQALCADGQAPGLSDAPCVQQALAGGSLLGDGEADGMPCILLATAAGEGALVGCLDGGTLRMELVSDGGSVCLLRNDGRVIAASPDSMLGALVGEDLFSALGMGEDMAGAVRSGGSAARGVRTAAGDFFAAWDTLDVGDGWHVLVLVPRTAVLEQFSFMGDAALELEVRLGACALALVALVIWVAWSSNRRLRAEKLRLEWSEERYRILAEDTNEVFWEYDVPNDRLMMGENFQRLYGREGSHSFADFIANAHPEEQGQLAHVFNLLKQDGASAETHATVDFRVRKGGEEGRYAWCRAHMSVLFDGRRRRRWIIGKLTDISQDRQLAERLEQQARTDPLTGLLNRAGLEEAIRLRVEGAPDRPCAIVLLDIDDFKDINDFYGHDVGDDVLRTLADFLRGHFRGTDIVGRLGGDEFMALMEGVDGP